jgi:hypothetical protein
MGIGGCDSANGTRFHALVKTMMHGRWSQKGVLVPAGNEPSSDPRFFNRVLPLTPDLAVRIEPDLRVDRAARTFEFKDFSYKRRFVRRQEALAIKREGDHPITRRHFRKSCPPD